MGIKIKEKEVRVNGVRLIPTEDEEQTWLFSWAAAQMGRFPELELMHHVPNGGKRLKSEVVRFRAMGVKAGVSDVSSCTARKYHGLYIEMKALDGRLTSEQKNFLTAVRKQGYFGVVCYGGSVAARVVERYLCGKCEGEGGEER